MDKEIIELIRGLSNNTQTVIIIYFVYDIIKHILSCIFLLLIARRVGEGVGKFFNWASL